MLAVVLAPALGTAMVGPAITLALLGALIVGTLIAQSPLARLAAIILGAILTFQSQSNALKVVFLGLVGVCCAFALREARNPRHAAMMETWRPFITASGWLLVYVGLTGPLAVTRGATWLDWARDASPLVFAAALPIIGLEAGLMVRHRTIMRVFVLTGVISTVSFILQWLTNREVSGIGRLTYGDNYLTASLFCLCLAAAAGGPRRYRSQLAAVSVFGSALLTGNRSLIVLALGFVGVIGSKSRLRMDLGHALRALALLALTLFLIIQTATALIPGERELLAQRVQVTKTYLETGEDQSARSRARQTGLAREELSKHPVFGTAPGHRYTDPFYIPGVSDPHRNRGSFFTLDTPLSLLAKLGFFGLAAILAWLLVMARCCVRWIRAHPPTVIGNALRAFSFIGVGLIPFGVTVEQKGFSVTMMLFIAGLVSARIARPTFEETQSRARAASLTAAQVG
jgi:hypothetical protein